MDASTLSAFLSDPTAMSSWFVSHPYILAIMMTWALVWKGLALWKSSKQNSPIWFIFLLVINTFGILEILYIFLFSKLGKKTVEKPASAKKKRK